MVIFVHKNASSHTAKPVSDTMQKLYWEVLFHVAYSPGLAPSNYRLFALVGYALAEQHFNLYKDFLKIVQWMIHRKNG